MHSIHHFYTFIQCEGARKTCVLYFRTSDQQHLLRRIDGFRTYMFDFRLILITEAIEAKAILLVIYQVGQFSFEDAILCLVKEALEYRILDPLTVSSTPLCHCTEPAATIGIDGADIVCYKHKHIITSTKMAGNHRYRRASTG